MKDLANKVAVVTGASKGIGAAIARHLGAEGASVVVNYSTSEEGADRVVDEIVEAGGRAIAIGGNVTKQSDVANLFAETKSAYGKVDILINNAGVYAFAPLEGVTVEEYKRQFDINVLGLLLTTQAALPLFPEAGGSIVNISSVMSTLSPGGTSVASGSKGAVDTITRALANELASRNIRVNAVNPGIVFTEGFTSAGLVGSDFAKHAVALTPLGRVGEPDDIAPPVVFLASENARWITGQTIKVAGGE